MAARLTHLDDQGAARMVDISSKGESLREAAATGSIKMSPETIRLIRAGQHSKGDVFAVARIAGIQAAKRCDELIPLCHALSLSEVRIDFNIIDSRQLIEINARCRLRGRTGAEMEALTAVSVAALTIYDMCKAADKMMVIGDIAVTEKKGGRSGHWQKPASATEK